MRQALAIKIIIITEGNCCHVAVLDNPIITNISKLCGNNEILFYYFFD